jgi:hypothetical protein
VRRILFAAIGLACSAQCVLAQTISEITLYTGMCDASAALALSEMTFVVASDEDNTLRVYQRGKSTSLQQFELSGFLEITRKSNKTGRLREADIEGATRIGNRTYWIGSHGRNSDGKQRLERHRLFALDVSVAIGGVKLAPVGRPYKDLLNDLASEASLTKYALREASQKRPKDDGALNIEGLAASNGALLIAFRNPRPGGKALIVPLENPDEVVAGTAGTKSRFGKPIELDLQGRGIRSIEFVESRNAFLIVAGAHNDDRKFALYEWRGPSASEAKPLGSVDFKDLTPEALFSFGKEIYLLSDDGSTRINGVACKDLFAEPQKQTFRGFVLSP